MVEKSDLKRINLEMCYPYCAQFKRSPGTGGVFKVGEGAFKVEKQLYDYDMIKPLQYYYPHEVSEELLEELIVKQIEGVKTGVKYLKSLIINNPNFKGIFNFSCKNHTTHYHIVAYQQ